MVLINYDTLTSFIGEPWVYQKNDCWSVFKRAAKSLFGIAVEDVKIPVSEDLSQTIAIFEEGAKSSQWRRMSALEPGCAVLFRNRRGHAIHIGLHIEKGNVLHCSGSRCQKGSTMYENIDDIMRKYGSCEYYEYSNNSN